ncbi:MAG: transposase [Anaerolineaceae bacterium]|nr:transposase [Anaerolineaceae bacterium]
MWVELLKTSHYQEGEKERYKIERKFGEAKPGHGLAHCRYVGTLNCGVQTYFTVMALNLKRNGKVAHWNWLQNTPLFYKPGIISKIIRLCDCPDIDTL